MQGGCVTGGGWGGLRSGMGVSVSEASVLDALGGPGWSLGFGVLLSLGSSAFLGKEHFVLSYKKKEKNYVNLTINSLTKSLRRVMNMTHDRSSGLLLFSFPLFRWKILHLKTAYAENLI